MTPTPDAAARLVQITHVAKLFERTADGVVAQLRGSLGVPPNAPPDIEHEFATWRKMLDDYLPEFCEQFATLFIQHLGEQHLHGVLEGLTSIPAQKYLAAAFPLESEFRRNLGWLSDRMSAVARAALET